MEKFRTGTAVDTAIIETKYGRLRGTVANGIHVFKGVPYGADTAGSARFIRPQPPEAWSGVRDALQYGPMCPQNALELPFDSTIAALLSGGFEIPSVAPSENCLALNLWTPRLRDGGRRPVMVWCHGGRFSEGSGGNGWCDGEALSRRGDVVVVTLNHRLNLFGHTHLGDLSGDDGFDVSTPLDGAETFADSGNVGLLDIIAALEWVRDHIAEFGGDPQNVTLFGNSGGGAKISTLMAMPAARGLFHKAIVQSAPLYGASGSRQRQHGVAATLLSQLGFAVPHQSARSLRELQTLPTERLLRAAAVVDAQIGSLPGMGAFVPAVDGVLIPEHPFQRQAPAIADPIPLLIGTTAEETTLLLGPEAFTTDTDQARRFLQHWASIDRSRAEQLFAAYRDNRPDASAGDLLVSITTDLSIRADAIAQADLKSRQSAAVYTYLFRWGIPAHGGIFGATHGAEVPFIFGNVDRAPGFNAKATQYSALEDSISNAWISFARTGNPNHSGLPHWPAYDSHTRKTLCFGGSAGPTVDDHDRNQCEVADDIGRLAMIATR